MPEALDALVSDDLVQVTAGRWWTFVPSDGGASAGIVIYPGARIDPRAYAPVARGIAARGNLVVIVHI